MEHARKQTACLAAWDYNNSVARHRWSLVQNIGLLLATIAVPMAIALGIGRSFMWIFDGFGSGPTEDNRDNQD